MNQVDIVQESQLIEAARSGSEQAQSAIARKYQLPLIGFIRSQIFCTKSDAEDIGQDVWKQVFSEIGLSARDGGYDPEKAGFYTYVVNRYARFVVRQFVKRRQRSRTKSLDGDRDDNDSGPPEVPDSSANPESILLDKEAAAERAELMMECFRLTFRFGGYPHQVLAFGYSKLIYGGATHHGAGLKIHATAKHSRELEGDPQRLDAEHGKDDLQLLLRCFWEDYCRLSRLDTSALMELRNCLLPTQDRMELTVREMTSNNKVFQQHHSSLLGHRVRETCMSDYYGSRGLNAIPDWCNKVQQRVRERLGI